MATPATPEDIKATIEWLDGTRGSSAVEQRIMQVFESMENPEQKRQAVELFYKLSSLNTEIQSAVQKIDLLKGLHEEDIQKETLVKTLQSLYRKKNRIIRMQAVQFKWTDAQQKLAQNKDIETTSAKDLYAIEQEGEGFLAKTFAYVKKEDGSQEAFKFDPEQAKKWQEILIDFWANKSADLRIWAGDILPSSVRVVRIVDTNGVETVGKRWSRPRPGYYDVSGKYLPVYSGYKIIIPKQDEITSRDEYRALQVTSVVASAEETKWYETEEKEVRTHYTGLLHREVKVDTGDDMIDNGENLKGEALWESFAFQAKFGQVCGNLGVKKEDMKQIMIQESGLNPKCVNRIGATGLIQFLPSTAESLGVTTGMLRAMPSWEQLDYVEKYYKIYAWRLDSLFSLHLATFYPYALGKPGDFILWSEPGARVSPEVIARQNSPIARWGDYITVDMYREFLERKAA